MSHSAFLRTVLNHGYQVTSKKKAKQQQEPDVVFDPNAGLASSVHASHKAAGAASSPTTPKPDMSQVIQPIIRFGDDACAAYMQAPFENCEMRTVVAFFVTDE